MATISVNGHTVHPESQQEGGSHYSPDASASSYILIQYSDNPSTEQVRQLKDLHVEILERLPHHTYLCSYDPSDLEVIRALPFVTYANVYHHDLVPHRSLAQKFARLESTTSPQSSTAVASAVSSDVPGAAAPASSKMLSVDVMLHPDSSMSPVDLKTHLINALGVEPNEIYVDIGTVKLDITADHIDHIANIDHVRGIQELPRYGLHSYQGSKDLKAGAVNARRMLVGADKEFEGDGEVVAVADSGFDRGLIDDTDHSRMHKAFKGGIVKLANFNYPLQDPLQNPQHNPPRNPPQNSRPAGNAAYDEHGHGTHVCGSVVGRFTTIPIDSNHTVPIRGTAPQARLFVHACDFSATLAKNWIYTDLLNHPYDDVGVKARIFSNSWGEDSHQDDVPDQYPYNNPATITDSIINGKRSLIALWAAGNGGEDKYPTKADTTVIRLEQQRVGGIASAKNILTVGACLSSHRQYKMKYRPLLHRGIPSVIPLMSSYGPTKEGRIKPDVVAPGTAILSARTRGPMGVDEDWEPEWDDDPTVRPIVRGDLNWWGTTPKGSDALFCTGTSMATPLVAGCVAVIRAVYKNRRRVEPNASMVKALVVNGAVDLTTEGTYITGRDPVRMPSNFQGFGRVDLDRSLLHITDTGHSKIVEWDSTTGPKLGGEEGTPPFYIPAASPNSTIKLSVSMAYTDKEGAELQNVVSLRVESVSGAVKKYGNTMTTDPDMINNVQKVVWTDIPEGDYKIVVHCYKTEGDSDTFRVACDVVSYWEEIPIVRENWQSCTIS